VGASEVNFDISSVKLSASAAELLLLITPVKLIFSKP
jgi:hypothetical protein